ncbi:MULTISPECIES: DUF397 domain-containing protein [unclassified Streptomyces]|uniref:DUF397 domain-containing protein n=1 Tax=unclassified Streptomyces TaxID=2593676 RepID=UPI0022552BF9|nr:MULTISPECIES: DUF397 domain-containing protein [unclassified Streptomyces]WSP56619.1 DUF397 domain-containing protein [Streptomyces sp. NBC_01241]WSU22663.1 DUF397 domain-containing protein [Streptomyces sp. NBC_01108]MCX4788366.1 DUF397 domain-containing protein [Streptomyces sp. NBC_01221]MCX4795873.1 DUF397 domain-containing protein [Streptomyces sp. NBC_01242]WSJ37155.1 DUF397 domain-containing protein [Streptomyces sp. NBC_01321]
MKISSSDYDLSTATWHKSSYSGGEGGDCLEAATWRKSTHSGGEGGNCLEVADGHPGIVPVRDSKATEGPTLVFRAAAWASFVADLKHT